MRARYSPTMLAVDSTVELDSSLAASAVPLVPLIVLAAAVAVGTAEWLVAEATTRLSDDVDLALETTAEVAAAVERTAVEVEE